MNRQQLSSLTFRIISAMRPRGEMLAKCEKYHARGVLYCWVIDPDTQTAREYHAEREPVKLAPNGVLRAGELAVPLAELFWVAGLNQLAY